MTYRTYRTYIIAALLAAGSGSAALAQVGTATGLDDPFGSPGALGTLPPNTGTSADIGLGPAGGRAMVITDPFGDGSGVLDRGTRFSDPLRERDGVMDATDGTNSWDGNLPDTRRVAPLRVVPRGE